jgi:hypothetical protein
MFVKTQGTKRTRFVYRYRGLSQLLVCPQSSATGLDPVAMMLFFVLTREISLTLPEIYLGPTFSPNCVGWSNKENAQFAFFWHKACAQPRARSLRGKNMALMAGCREGLF